MEDFASLFVGQEVEVLLLHASATSPVPGVSFPNEGTLVSYDSNGVVLRRKEGMLFFPYATIRLIRRKANAVAAPATPPPMAKKVG